MLNIFSRRYQSIRIAILLLAGTATIFVAWGRHVDFQNAPVNVSPAPELVGSRWVNTATPISLASRRGKVTMVEFFAFECSNCLANMPTYERWQKKFAPQGFTVLGVHTPELASEYKEAGLKKFLSEHGITYPVLADNDYKNWSRWNQEYWPAVYLIDKKGNVREKWVGELNSVGMNGEAKLTSKIEQLLAE